VELTVFDSWSVLWI